jgi:diguanylate cyclase (GGDEF)-like protein
MIGLILLEVGGALEGRWQAIPMAAAFDDDDTLESQALTTSLDPYGQLIKMLMPRALCIVLYDADGLPLWLSSDTFDSTYLQQLVEEALSGVRSGTLAEEEREGFARSWDGDTSYIFMLRAGDRLLGAVAVSCRDGSGGSRPFSLVLALLRPALQVLSRELASQSSIEELQKNLMSRESDLDLLLDANGAEADTDDPRQLVGRCARSLDATLGTLLIPDKSIEMAVPGVGAIPADAAAVVDRTQRHLYAWAQVQRRTLLLNKSPTQGPLADVPYKMLAAPILHQGRNAMGVLTLFRSRSAADFDLRQARIVEMMGRRIAYVLQNAYDPTSGLLTRPAFEQRVLALLAAADPAAEHCVAYGDIDRLHVINENHGMHVGDRVIERVAAILREQLPPDVLAARISGDRFALFFPDRALETAQQASQSLCRAIEASELEHEGARVQLSMSIGIADVPKAKLPLSHALATAEVACKAAKDRGRNRVEIYQEADCSIVRRYEDGAVIGRIRDALASDEFRMEAQPLQQLTRGAGQRRFELLLRMIDANGESVAPEKFLVAAERYQLATEIDRWVVQYALEVLASAAPRLEALGAHFAINISGQSLGDDHFTGFLEGKLREYGLPPRLLSFEITETAAVANIVRAEMLIRRLRDLGYGIALDDFGRGLSSLTYLKSLPVTDLKIDGGLVRDLAANERSQAMVTAIVQLANAMGLTTTAECVENEAIQAAVKRLGVNYGQGFAIGRPRPLERVLQDLLRAEPAPARGLSISLLSRLAG